MNRYKFLSVLIDVLTFLKMMSRSNSLLGYFLKANCKELQLHKDGYVDLLHVLDEHAVRLQPSVGKVPFALVGTIDLTQSENITFCKLCLALGVKISCDTSTIIKSTELVE
ncbi:MAG: hypothetical protein GX568_06430 [Candidatus Gastranaerophilales bacterium]|nr:hypothetical protein [Candidatus Gastranaerophilales bacterium]